MSQETVKTIHIPGHWESPKYHFGQMVDQGQIIGMEYHPPGTLRAYELGEGWFYTLMIDKLRDDVETIKESAIKSPTPEDLSAEIDSLKALIESCQNNIATLTQQLEKVQAS